MITSTLLGWAGYPVATDPRVVRIVADHAEIEHGGAVYLLPIDVDQDPGPRMEPAVSVRWDMCSVETCEELQDHDDLLTEALSDEYMRRRRDEAA